MILPENETLELLERWIEQIDVDEDKENDYIELEIKDKEVIILKSILTRYKYIQSCNYSYKRKMRVLTNIMNKTLKNTIDEFINEGNPELRE
tara:strand:- start:98 stop:373 length:276 start_codon:yes stop_codon:yes gene_type:complete